LVLFPNSAENQAKTF